MIIHPQNQKDIEIEELFYKKPNSKNVITRLFKREYEYRYDELDPSFGKKTHEEMYGVVTYSVNFSGEGICKENSTLHNPECILYTGYKIEIEFINFKDREIKSMFNFFKSEYIDECPYLNVDIKSHNKTININVSFDYQYEKKDFKEVDEAIKEEKKRIKKILRGFEIYSYNVTFECYIYADDYNEDDESMEDFELEYEEI